jgi:predicted transcriptional regulator
MYQRRGKDQIISKVLSTCQGDGANKTKVVYASNLNFKNAREYLSLLTRKGLLEVIPGEHILYKTTSTGERALERLREIEVIFS